MLRLSESRLKILQHLAMYRFLTTDQLLELWVAKYRNSLYPMLKDLKEVAKPLIEQIKMPVDMQRWQFPSILHLTSAGANLLRQELWYSPHEIKYPKSRSKVFTQYHHKVATVETHIQFRKWAEKRDADTVMFETYFDMEKKGKKFISLTQFPISAEEIVIPDAVGICFDWWQEHLMVLEIYNGYDIGRTITQLKKHLIGLANLAATKKFESDWPYKILIIFLEEKHMKGVLYRLRKAKAFAEAEQYFLFKTINQIKDSESDFFEGRETYCGNSIHITLAK